MFSLLDDCVDCIIVSLFIYYIFLEDWECVFGEMICILKIGGKFLILDFEGVRICIGKLIMCVIMYGVGF